DKLPPARRDRARVVGLGLALIMRLALLAGISWVVSLTRPLFSVFGLELSGRDLILLAGGLFLLLRRPWSCTSGSRAKRTGVAGRRRTPVSGWSWRRSWRSTRCSRSIRSSP